MKELQDRLAEAQKQVPTVKNKQARRDLYMMLKSTESAYNKISQESVECRRLHRVTPRYDQLVKNCEELLEHLEKHLTFAKLLGY